MASLIDIKGVGARARELLEAAGVTTVADLATADAASLHETLASRNESIKALKNAPSAKSVASWIDGARALVGVEVGAGVEGASASAPDGPVSAAGDTRPDADEPPTEESGLPNGDTSSSAAPTRLSPDDYAILASSALEVSEIFDEYGGRLGTGFRRRTAQPTPGKPLDTSRVHTFDDLNAGRIEVKPLARRPQPGDGAEDQHQAEGPLPEVPELDGPPPPVETGASDEPAAEPAGAGAGTAGAAPGLEEPAAAASDAGAAAPAAAPSASGRSGPGRKGSQRRRMQRVQAPGPNAKPSRWVRRGLENHHPVRTYIWMVVALAFRLLVLTLVVAAPVALAAKEFWGHDFIWLLAPVLLAMICFGLLHLVGISKVRCSVCSCPILYSRHCRKNEKAHRFFPLGFVGATALHAVIFRWYRCMYCGTPSQLGEDPYRNEG